MGRVKRIGVLSDTHIPRRFKRLPNEVMEGLRGVDLILHAGDIVDIVVIDELSKLAPVEAVAGNNDPEEIHRRFGWKRVIGVGSLRIGLIHGDRPGRFTFDNAYRAFAGADVDCIVFGHTHFPLKEYRGATLMFNPGSPTDRRRAKAKCFGILKIGPLGVSARHYFF